MKKALPLALALISMGFTAFTEEPKERPEQHRPHFEPSPEQMLGRLVERLNLDDSQKSLAEGIMLENKTLREQYKTKTDSLVTEMKSLHESEILDEARMIEIGRDLGELKVRQGLLMKKFFDQLSVHLSEDQLEKFKEMRDRMKHMMDKHRPNGPRPPRGPERKPKKDL